MIGTLAKFYDVKVDPNWALFILVIVAATAVAGLVIWRTTKKK